MAGRKRAEEPKEDPGRTEAGQVTPATLPTSAEDRVPTPDEDIIKGLDGGPVTPNNPVPKAVVYRD